MQPLDELCMIYTTCILCFAIFAYGREAVDGSSSVSAAEQTRRDRRDRQIRKTMYAMIPIGLCTVAAGFGIWTLDNVYCSTLRGWWREIGLPWGILLEGHGWVRGRPPQTQSHAPHDKTRPTDTRPDTQAPPHRRRRVLQHCLEHLAPLLCPGTAGRGRARLAVRLGHAVRGAAEDTSTTAGQEVHVERSERATTHRSCFGRDDADWLCLCFVSSWIVSWHVPTYLS